MPNSDTSARTAAAPRRDLPSLLLSALLLAMGVTVLVDAAQVEAPPGAGAVGPAAFMWAIGVALVVLAVVLGLVALRGRPDEELAANPFVAPAPHAEDGSDGQQTTEVATGPEPAGADDPRPFLQIRPAGRVALLLGGLLLHAAIISTAGYIVAAAVLFLCSSLAFGAPRLLPPVLIGTALAVAIFYGFVWGLGLGLPYLGGG